MLQNIRKNLQGTIAKIIVAIIVVPFALFGIESLLSGGGIQYVAEVNGEKISAIELQEQVNQQRRRLLMTLGDNVDPSMLDDQVLAGPSLEYIIQKKLLMQRADEYGMAVSDANLGDMIANMQVFQEGGRFDPNLFRRVIADQGYSPASFQQALREERLVNQLRFGIAGSTFATEADVAHLARIQQEQRDIRYAVLPLERFRGDAEISDEAVAAWYEANQSSFMTEESVDLEFIELTLDDFEATVDEARLRELYEIDKETFSQPEERRVSHILLVRGDDESDAALQQRENELRARLDGGEEFAILASEFSDDVGSAADGGDLGYTSGDVFPAEMEEAIALLDVGEVSGPVTTDAGIHIIKLTELRGGSALSFEQVRPELEARLQEEEGTRQLVKTVERLRDLAFNAETLAGPAEELELSTESVEGITRGQSQGLFANPRLIAAAFSKDVLEDGYNSDVLEIDTEHFVVLRVREHHPPELRPLDEVRGGIVARLRDEAAREDIVKKAQSLLLELRDGATVESVAQANDYEWQVELATRRNNPAVPADVLRRAFELPAPADGKTVFDYVQSNEGDVQIFELVRVVENDGLELEEQQRQVIERQLISEQGQRTDSYYQQALIEAADISRS